VPVRRKRTAAFQVKGPVACFPRYALYLSSAMGLKSSGGGGGDPDDDGSRGADSVVIVAGDDDGDVLAGDCVGCGDCGGVGVPCGGGLDEVASTFGCGGSEFVCVDLLAGGVFEGMAAGECLASLEGGFDVEGLLTGFCGDDLLALLGGGMLPFCLFLVFA